jgi:hypothetical protein
VLLYPQLSVSAERLLLVALTALSHKASFPNFLTLAKVEYGAGQVIALLSNAVQQHLRTTSP